MKRCLNIDWLEVYCLETDVGFPHDADYFQQQGFYVEKREYGTRVYDQMFTIYDTYMQPMIEVRREPVAVKRNAERSVIHPRSCHLRLVNRYCYYSNAAEVMTEFIARYGFEYQSIYRVDLCLDFEKFDSGDNPAQFIKRYLERKFAKINQTEIRAHGAEQWDGIEFTSLSWGAPTSPISTKIYDKTLEIKQASQKLRKPYKPWIPQAWVAAGLITDFMLLTKTDGDKIYSPRIWRLEFSIKSKVKNWVTMKNNHREESHHKYLSKLNNLQVYSNDDSKLQLFASLVHQYFFFRYYEQGKRKYDCKEKKLFNFNVEELVKVEKPLTTSQKHSKLAALLSMLQEYQATKFEFETRETIFNVIKIVQKDYENEFLDAPFNPREKLILQALMSLATAKNQYDFETEKNKIIDIINEGNPIY